MKTDGRGGSIRMPLTKTEALLAAIVVLAGLQTVRGFGLSEPRSASAQVGSMSLEQPEQQATRRDSQAATFINPAIQREQMITELRQVNERLRRVESELAAGLKVQAPPAAADR